MRASIQYARARATTYKVVFRVALEHDDGTAMGRGNQHATVCVVVTEGRTEVERIQAQFRGADATQGGTKHVVRHVVCTFIALPELPPLAPSFVSTLTAPGVRSGV